MNFLQIRFTEIISWILCTWFERKVRSKFTFSWKNFRPKNNQRKTNWEPYTRQFYPSFALSFNAHVQKNVLLSAKCYWECWRPFRIHHIGITPFLALRKIIRSSVFFHRAREHMSHTSTEKGKKKTNNKHYVSSFSRIIFLSSLRAATSNIKKKKWSEFFFFFILMNFNEFEQHKMRMIFCSIFSAVFHLFFSVNIIKRKRRTNKFQFRVVT